MSRLIDVDKAIKDLKQYTYDCNLENIGIVLPVIRVLDKQPTAFDVDKVVKKLESLVEDREEDIINDEYTYGECSAYEHAIEVVKRGGIDETK